MYSGKKSRYAIKIGMMAVIIATLTLTVVAAGPLSVDETNQPFDSNISKEQNKTDAVQQPSNNTTFESPNEKGQSHKNDAGQPAGSVIPTNVGIYSDSACTQPVTSIDWGSFAPGGSVKRTIYIKNAQKNPLTLNMSTTNWVPTHAAESITITWNKENLTLASQESTAATLTLTVASNISGISQFSVAIVIAGI